MRTIARLIARYYQKKAELEQKRVDLLVMLITRKPDLKIRHLFGGLG
jgi:hypothetical protein